MTGQQDAVSTYVSVLVRDEVEVRALVPTRTPLEALFFMLTDDPNHQTLARPEAGREAPQ